MAQIVNNPFSEMLVSLSSRRFFGRATLLREILQGVSGPVPRSFALSGQRLLGKTSLLRFLGERPGAMARHGSALLDYGPGHEGELSFLYLNFYKQDGETVLPTLQRSLQQHHEKLGLHMKWGGEAQQDLAQGLRELQREKKTRLVFCLDHFDQAYRTLPDLADLTLRSLSELAAFILTTEDSLFELRPHATRTSPIYGVLLQRNLELLAPIEAAELVSAPPAQAGDPFGPPEQELLLQAAGRHPYLLTLAGEFQFSLRLQHPEIRALLAGPQIEPALTNRLRQQLAGLPPVQDIFSYYWGRLDAGQQKTLFQVTQPGASPDGDDLPALVALQRRSLVTDDPLSGSYRPFCELFHMYVQQQMAGATAQTASEYLSPLDRRVFERLKTSPAQLFTRETLLQEFWPGRPEKEARRGLEAVLHRVRGELKKQDPDWEYIENVRGSGYRYNPRPGK